MDLTVEQGDITEQQVDAVVNAANRAMRGGGGVDGAIHSAGGPAVLEDCKRRFPDGLATGDAGWTTAGEMPARWVIHVVGPNYRAGQTDRGLLTSCYARALEVADELGARTVAFPLVSAGIYGWPKDDAIAAAIETLRVRRHEGHRGPAGGVRRRDVRRDPGCAGELVLPGRHISGGMGAAASRNDANAGFLRLAKVPNVTVDDLVPGCFCCDQQAAISLPPREDVLHTDHWRVAHAFNSTLPGWLVLLPTRHITSFTELTPEAADELGSLIRRLGAALQAVTGCVKTYLMQFSEAVGFSHLHLHLVPRLADHPENARGPRVFAYLTDDESRWLPDSERDRVALSVRSALA